MNPIYEARAAEALEKIATPEAKRALEKMPVLQP